MTAPNARPQVPTAPDMAEQWYMCARNDLLLDGCQTIDILSRGHQLTRLLTLFSHSSVVGVTPTMNFSDQFLASRQRNFT